MHKTKLYILIIITLLLIPVLTHAEKTRGFSVVARDEKTGEMKRLKLYDRSYAVIIGIDWYKNMPLKSLENAVSDAKGVEKTLKTNFEFDDIFTLYNEEATKDGILDTLMDKLGRKTTKEDAVFIFWSGHGYTEKTGYGELGYLIPYDGSFDSMRKNISMTILRDDISKTIKAKHVFYVIDACYSGLLLAKKGGKRKTERSLSYLKDITKEDVRQILTAGGKDQEVLDGGPFGYSVFTGRFIQALKEAKDYIIASELSSNIKRKVYSDARARNHKQKPQSGELFGLGDYVFIPAKSMEAELKEAQLKEFNEGITSKSKELIRLEKMLAEEEVLKKERLKYLKEMEEANEVAKKREAKEIEMQKQALLKFDEKIKNMKQKLGASAPDSDSNLDTLLAMVEQKEEQERKIAALKKQREEEERRREAELEKLRKQRKEEERKKQAEIERLKREEYNKIIDKIKKRVDKYNRIVSSKYGKGMKTQAWKSVIKDLPKEWTEGVKEGDTYSIVLGPPIERDGQYVKYSNGVVYDKNTGLEWYAGPDKDTTWYEAKSWVENLTVAGGGWRMPGKSELKALYKKGKGERNMTPLLETTGWFVWASETKGSSSAWYYSFSYGLDFWLYRGNSRYERGFAVRSR